MSTTMNARAGGTINIGRIVTSDTSNPNGVVQAADATTRPRGVATDQSRVRPDPDLGSTNYVAANSGESVKVHTETAKAVPVWCNDATINDGDLVMSSADGNGYAIKWTTGHWYVGVAQNVGVVGAMIPIDIAPGYA